MARQMQFRALRKTWVSCHTNLYDNSPSPRSRRRWAPGRCVLALFVVTACLGACGGSDGRRARQRRLQRTSGTSGTSGSSGSSGNPDGGSSSGSADGRAPDGALPGSDASPPPDVDAGPITPPAATCTPPHRRRRHDQAHHSRRHRHRRVVHRGRAHRRAHRRRHRHLRVRRRPRHDHGDQDDLAPHRQGPRPRRRRQGHDRRRRARSRILDYAHGDFRKNTHVLTLQHVTFAHGHASGSDAYAPAPAPCSTGFYDGSGGALRMRDGVLHVIDATFLNNQAREPRSRRRRRRDLLDRRARRRGRGLHLRRQLRGERRAIGVLERGSRRVQYTLREQRSARLRRERRTTQGNAAWSPRTANTRPAAAATAAPSASTVAATSPTRFCGLTLKSNKGGKQALGGAIFRTPDLAKQTTVIDRCLFDGNSRARAAAPRTSTTRR